MNTPIPNLNTMPSWLTSRAMAIYIIALVMVSVLYSQCVMPVYWMIFGVAQVVIFFYGSQWLCKKWGRLSPKKYERNILTWSILIRAIALWLFLSIYKWLDAGMGFSADDSGYYLDLARYTAEILREGRGHLYSRLEAYSGADLSDMGNSIYMGVIYLLVGNEHCVFVVQCLNILWSTWTVLLMYKLARNNFGEDVGRMAGIFCMLMPNLWVYNSLILKETEMVFLCVLFVEQADEMLRSRNFSAWKIVPLLLVGFLLFTMRTPLALVAIMALLFAIVMSSTRVVSWGKKILVGVLTLGLVGITMGNRIQEETKALTQNMSGNQRTNMSWRSTRAGGNSYAKYASAVVFAPLIFTIPFSSMVKIDGQDFQQMMNGGYFIKNILSGFIIFIMFVFLLSGDWRNHAVPIAFMIGYLVVLVFSSFAQSERFHQPILPFSLMFAAYGIQYVISGAKIAPHIRIGSRQKYKQWFSIWSIAILAMIIAWNWFKLAGRGLV